MSLCNFELSPVKVIISSLDVLTQHVTLDAV